MMSSVNIFVLGDIVTIKASVLGLALGRYRALGYVHYLSRIILALMSKDYKRKGLTRLGERYFHTELEAPLAEQRDSSISGSKYSLADLFVVYIHVVKSYGGYRQLCLDNRS